MGDSPSWRALYVKPSAGDAAAGDHVAGDADAGGRASVGSATGSESEPLTSLATAWHLAVDLSAESPVRVILREGTHYLESTLVLSGRSPGSHPITFEAYPGERPCISGAVRIAPEWRRWNGDIYVASLKGQVPPSFDQLFVNGRRQIRARYPNGDPHSPLLSNYSFIEGADEREYPEGRGKTARPPLPHREVYYAPELFTGKTWEHPEDGIIHIFPRENWNALQFELRGIDHERRAILLGKGGFQQHERFAARPGTMLDRTSRYYIENIFEELDSPGEWYFDPRNQDLYYWPPADVDLKEAVVEAPVLKELVRFEGTRDRPCRDVSFRGVRFTGTRTTFLDEYEVVSFGDWAIVRSGAVFFENAVACAIEDCFFDAVGGNAVFASRYNEGITVRDCLITECGESAIALVGSSMLRRDRSSTCPFCGEIHPWGFTEHTDEYPSGCRIENNLIHDVGAWGKQTAALFMAVTARNSVRHNEFYNIPRAAMCIHDGTFGGHVIEHNYMHHSCRDTDEHGTFNSWGRDSWWCHAQSHQGVSHPAGPVLADAKFQTVIRNNRFRDFTGWCIDLDDGSSNYDIYNNVCIGAGIKNREGDYRKVHNNVVYLPTIPKPTAIQVGCEDNSDAWYSNIIVAYTDCIHLTLPPHNGRIVKYCDRNVYYSHAGVFSSRGMDFQAWRDLGLDEHSVHADPLFRDPDAGDFTVLPDSPALGLGFVNVPQDCYGTQDFPTTWGDLEPHHPVYDYDTMNRDMLKNLRDEAVAVEPEEDGSYVLDPERGRTESPLSYAWRLRYRNGGEFTGTVTYASESQWGCTISATVESIGESSVTRELPASRSTSEFVFSDTLSLSGEDTDIIEIRVTAEGCDTLPLIVGVQLVPQSSSPQSSSTEK